MGLSNFQIILDSPNGAYYAGTNVTGRLQFILDKPKKVRAVTIKFVGVAKTSWSEAQNVTQFDGSSNTEIAVFSDEEECLSITYPLAGGTDNEIEIPPGNHVYPFSTALPPLIPSSFEGKHGNICYSVRATLDRPWKFDHDVEEPFTVVTPVDLNFIAEARESATQEVDKYFGCCWCQSGPLTMVLQLPYSGFVPGQDIPVTVEVDNASNVKVENVSLTLEKELMFETREPRRGVRRDKEELVKVSLDAVDGNCSRSFNQQLSVPDVTVYYLDQCPLINCTYSIQATAEVDGYHINLHAKVPVFLGNVPLKYSPEDEEHKPAMTFNSGPTEDNLYPVLTSMDSYLVKSSLE